MDIAGARASLNRVKWKDADFEALDRIIKKREANPTAKFHASTSARTSRIRLRPSTSARRREEGKKIAKSDSRVDKLRVGLDASARSAFDRAQVAYKKVAHADGERVYQEYIDGSGRSQEALDQEARVRRNFVATIKVLVTGPRRPARGSQEFEDADEELNAVYNENVSSYVTFNEDSATDADNGRTRKWPLSIERATATTRRSRGPRSTSGFAIATRWGISRRRGGPISGTRVSRREGW